MHSVIGFPLREVQITWKKEAKFSEPYSITFYGTKWRTASGIKRGLTLEQLEFLNKKPYEMSGFDSCGGPIVESWQNGKLRKEMQANNLSLIVHLNSDNDARLSDFHRLPLSNDKVMYKCNIKVSQMSVSF